MAAPTRGPNFGHLLKTGQYSDLTLVCGGKEFNVHKMVVCSQSEVLATAIREPFQESKTGTISVEEFDAVTVDKMLEFLYTGDYGSLTAPGSLVGQVGETDEPLASPAAVEQDDLLQHVRLNSIADYYDIKPLAELSKAKLRLASQNTLNEPVLLNVAQEALNRTGDTTLHTMLAEAIGTNIRKFLETKQLAEIVGGFGVEILRTVVARQGELQRKMIELQFQLARLRVVEKRSAQIVENINSCMRTLGERRECRNSSCRADFECYIEQRGQPYEPLFVLRCAQCQCRH